MDPISVQEITKDISEEQESNKLCKKITVSNKSLSKYEGKSSKVLLPQIVGSLVAVSLHVAVGLSMSFSGILIPAIDKVRQNGTDDDGKLYATQAESAWIASILAISVPIGSVSSGYVADHFGRLLTIKLSIVPFVFGWCLIASAQNIIQILIGRFLTGFAMPWSSIPATVYVSEIARADLRGSLIVFAPTLASTGMFLCYLQGWFLHWRTVAWISNAFIVFPVIMIYFIPESPAWLVEKERIKDAAKSLEWFNKYQPQPYNMNESLAELQLQELQNQYRKKMAFQASRGNMGFVRIIKEFLKPTAYKPMLLLTGIFTFQMFSGVYITLFYSVTFFQEVGSTLNPYFASTLICFIRMVMALSNAYLLKKFNRRSLLIVSGVGMTFCMIFSGLSTHWIKTGVSDQTYLPVVFMLLYVTTSMIGMLTIPWTMMCELFPLEIRGIANSVAYSVGNVIMFASIQSFYGLLFIFQGYAGIQWFFAVVSALACLYTYIFMPETHRKKLYEITEYFEENFVYILSNKNSPIETKIVDTNGVDSNGTVKNDGGHKRLLRKI